MHRTCISVVVFLNNYVQIQADKWKSAFIEMTSFKSFVSCVPSFDVGSKLPFIRKTFVQKYFRKSRWYVALSTVCFFQPMLQLSKKSSCQPLPRRFLYLHASDVGYTEHVRSKKLIAKFALRHRPPKEAFYRTFCVCKTWILPSSSLSD